MTPQVSRTRAIALTPGLVDRFWQKVDRSNGSESCWLWQGKAQNGGYGVIHGGGARTYTIYAHRISWFIANGRDPIGFAVCHRCDVPGCVNPAHLFLGTIADNVADMIAKGRNAVVAGGARVRGELVHGAKLTADRVRAIRSRSEAGASSTELAGEYGVDSSTIRQIVRRQIWRHVDGEARS